jgi:hypothetical protein
MEARMTPNESHDEKMTRITAELSKALRRQAAGTWRRVRTANRGEAARHAWKFQPTPDGSSRFLRITHEAMTQGDDPVAQMLSNLSAGRWLARLDDGPETSLLLQADGRLERFKAR